MAERRRRRYGVLEEEGGDGDVPEVRVLTLAACVSTAILEVDGGGRNCLVKPAGAEEGNRPACSIAGLPFRFLA